MATGVEATGYAATLRGMVDVVVARPVRKDGGMREELVVDLEAFIHHRSLWERADLEAIVSRLRKEAELTGDPLPRLLAHPFNSLLIRLEIGAVPDRTARDVESIIYPRVWKVMEGVRDGVPDGELRTRIEVLNRRLARRFAEET